MEPLYFHLGEESISNSPDHFYSRLEGGADCNELFGIRNALDPKSEQIPAMNRDLRAIGCLNSFDIRTDKRTRDSPVPSSLTTRSPTSAPSPTPVTPTPALSPEETFTVREYRIYRMVLDTPLAVSEEEAFRRAAAKHRATNVGAREIFDKVQRILTENNWFGPPRYEINRAVDWSGERE